MIVKICGITTEQDALAAAEAGASALGFNFYPRSPRYVTPAHAAEIATRLPAGILRVGIFVSEPAARVEQIASEVPLDVAQIYGDTGPLSLRLWKAIRIGDSFAPALVEDDPVEEFLLDSAGNGVQFPWSLARGLKKKIVIAGGLDATNVRQAIREARPWGVDACSRLESEPGRKDHERVRQFVKAALTENL